MLGNRLVSTVPEGTTEEERRRNNVIGEKTSTSGPIVRLKCLVPGSRSILFNCSNYFGCIKDGKQFVSSRTGTSVDASRELNKKHIKSKTRAVYVDRKMTSSVRSAAQR